MVINDEVIVGSRKLSLVNEEPITTQVHFRGFLIGSRVEHKKGSISPSFSV